MRAAEKISTLLQTAPVLEFDRESKLVLMSDCHRGSGNLFDNFAPNQNAYTFALSHYLSENFTYIELGDGDELWENSNFLPIGCNYREIFVILRQFYQKKRLHMLYGNHDIIKKNTKWLRNYYDFLYNDKANQLEPFLTDIVVHESLLLRHAKADHGILLLHGHQVDLANSTFCLLSRFLVRYVWRPMQLFGVRDPFSLAKNYNKRNRMEKKLTQIAEQHNKMLICGHTHRPVFPTHQQPPYFNTGSAVSPYAITAIEIQNNAIALVKWSIKTRADGTLMVGKDTLGGPEPLCNYFTHCTK